MRKEEEVDERVFVKRLKSEGRTEEEALLQALPWKVMEEELMSGEDMEALVEDVTRRSFVMMDCRAPSVPKRSPADQCGDTRIWMVPVPEERDSKARPMTMPGPLAFVTTPLSPTMRSSPTDIGEITVGVDGVDGNEMGLRVEAFAGTWPKRVMATYLGSVLLPSSAFPMMAGCVETIPRVLSRRLEELRVAVEVTVYAGMNGVEVVDGTLGKKRGVLLRETDSPAAGKVEDGETAKYSA
jgi:hypothetical protein